MSQNLGNYLIFLSLLLSFCLSFFLSAFLPFFHCLYFDFWSMQKMFNGFKKEEKKKGKERERIIVFNPCHLVWNLFFFVFSQRSEKLLYSYCSGASPHTPLWINYCICHHCVPKMSKIDTVKGSVMQSLEIWYKTPGEIRTSSIKKIFFF